MHQVSVYAVTIETISNVLAMLLEKKEATPFDQSYLRIHYG